MTGTDDYVSIDCEIVRVTSRAVLIEVEDDFDTEEHWIPRSLIHGGDDSALEKSVGNKMQIRMFRWKAAELGID